MVGWRNSILLALIILVVGLVFWVNNMEAQGNTGKVIQHCLDCKRLSLDTLLSHTPLAEDHDYQVVIYTRNLTWELATFNLNWELLVEKFPEINFIFYYGGQSEEKLINWMTENDFSFPVIFDPEDSFRKKNLEGDLTGIVLNVQEGKVVSLLNPSFGEEYNSFLEKWVD